jgi:hypothetical protein
MSANYAGLNIRPLRVWYTGFDSNGTRGSRNVIALTNGRVPIGAILCKDPFQWENGGSGIGAATDNPTTGVRTGTFEGMDYTRPQTSILNQHKVVVIGGGEPPAGNPNGGRFVDVIECADVCNVLLNGTVTAGDQLVAVNNQFYAQTAPATSVAELLAIINTGIGQALDANSAGPNLRAVKLKPIGSPSLS